MRHQSPKIMDDLKCNIKCKNIKKILLFLKNNYFFEQKQSRNGSCLQQKINIQDRRKLLKTGWAKPEAAENWVGKTGLFIFLTSE